MRITWNEGLGLQSGLHVYAAHSCHGFLLCCNHNASTNDLVLSHLEDACVIKGP